MNSDIYIIVFPGGNLSRLSIVVIERCNLYQLDEYDRASRHMFHDASEVVEYAKELARQYNLPLSSQDPKLYEMLDGDGFLD